MLGGSIASPSVCLGLILYQTASIIPAVSSCQAAGYVTLILDTPALVYRSASTYLCLTRKQILSMAQKMSHPLFNGQLPQKLNIKNLGNKKDSGVEGVKKMIDISRTLWIVVTQLTRPLMGRYLLL